MIDTILNILLETLKFGIPYAILALGVFISFRVLDFADMTTEGTFVFGGAITIVCIVLGINPWIATVLSVIGGIIAGIITGLLHSKLKIPGLLSGIITMTGLTSINFVILGLSKTDAPFFEKFNSYLTILYKDSDPTIFGSFEWLFGANRDYSVILLLIILATCVSVTLYFFFGTEIGMSLRSTGMNEKMSRAQGINTGLLVIVGLAISNAFIGLAGSLAAQRDLTVSTVSGQGILVVGLASIILGESLFGKRTFKNWMISVFFGAIIYYLIIKIALKLGFPDHLLKLLYAVIMAIILALPIIKKVFGKKEDSLEDLLIENEESAIPSPNIEINYAKPIENPKTMLETKNLTKIFNPTGNRQDIKRALNHINLDIKEGEFVTIIGGNGSGKSTFFNVVSGVYDVTLGNIHINGEDVTKLPEFKRSYYIGRVAQDPYQGTAANMSILENMCLAMRRDQPKTLKWGFKKNEIPLFIDKVKTLGLGLENRIETKIGLLSGGQRQAVTLLMATLQKPDILFLDEHTAALDPKTANTVLELTNKVVRENNLTTIMVTHNMKDAIKYGDRLLMFNKGKIIFDVKGEEKKNLTVEQLLRKFENEVEFSDKDILG